MQENLLTVAIVGVLAFVGASLLLSRGEARAQAGFNLAVIGTLALIVIVGFAVAL